MWSAKMSELTELKQGDNSSVIKVSIPSFPDISDANWIGEYTLRERNIKGAIVQQEIVGKETDDSGWVFFITAENSAILNVGTLFLSIEVRNMTLTPSFRQEPVQRVLTIKSSGVPNT
jgi:hypothetical protein